MWINIVLQIVIYIFAFIGVCACLGGLIQWNRNLRVARIIKAQREALEAINKLNKK